MPDKDKFIKLRIEELHTGLKNKQHYLLAQIEVTGLCVRGKGLLAQFLAAGCQFL